MKSCELLRLHYFVRAQCHRRLEQFESQLEPGNLQLFETLDTTNFSQD